MVEFGIETFSSNAIRRASSCASLASAKLSLSQIEMHIGRIAPSLILAQRLEHREPPPRSRSVKGNLIVVGLAEEAEIDAELVVWPASDDCL